MGDSHAYTSSDPEEPEATNFNFPPSIYQNQPPVVLSSNFEAGPQWNPSSHSVIPHGSLHQSPNRDFRPPMAADLTPIPNHLRFPWTFNSPISYQNRQPNHPIYAPLPPPFSPMAVRLTHQTGNVHGASASLISTSPYNLLETFLSDSPNANPRFARLSVVHPTLNYDHMVMNPTPFETLPNDFGSTGMNAAAAPNEAGVVVDREFEKILAGSAVESTNLHRQNTVKSQKTLEITTLKRTFILYFSREEKRIWVWEELLFHELDPVQEGLDGPVIFGPSTSPAYVEVTLDGKVCLPSSANHRERNNFLRGQLKSIVIVHTGHHSNLMTRSDRQLS
ncbi:hypothetical protein BT69DRAFT_1352580 [Atractiella rhizophila]|nr:hypothetical protein BT69DRAFT_1352580 [Atractiella rhizophila]